MQIFTSTELSWMRDPSRARNRSAEKVVFRREHWVRRGFGPAQRHAAQLRRKDPDARTPDGRARWIEALRTEFREAYGRQAQASAEAVRDLRRAAGELFHWPSFTNRWLKKYAAPYRHTPGALGAIA